MKCPPESYALTYTFSCIVINNELVVLLSLVDEFKFIHIHTQNPMTMGYKTISLSDEAYEILKKAKRDNESFSQVVIRLVRKRSLDDFIGCISKKSVSKLADALAVFREERSTTWSESMEEMLG